MQVIRYISILGVFLFLIACSEETNTLSPQFEPEIINNTDSFEFKVTGVDNVTQTLTYTWKNTGTQANINQSSTITSGSATLKIEDVNSEVVYQKDLKENGSFSSVFGFSGDWKITVTLSKVSGDINFRVEKRTP